MRTIELDLTCPRCDGMFRVEITCDVDLDGLFEGVFVRRRIDEEGNCECRWVSVKTHSQFPQIIQDALAGVVEDD